MGLSFNFLYYVIAKSIVDTTTTTAGVPSTSTTTSEGTQEIRSFLQFTPGIRRLLGIHHKSLIVLARQNKL